MRNKKWLILVAALLVVGLLSMTLVACVDKNKPQPPTPDPTADEIIESVVNNIANTYVVDDARMFGIDVLVDAELQEADNSRMWKYEFLAKADIDLYSENTSMRIEVNSYAKDESGKDVKTTLFGLYYESEFNNEGVYSGSYFYVTIAGAAPIKTEAYSMLKLVNAIAGNPDETVADLDIKETLISIIAMFASDAKVSGNTYTLTFDLQHIWSSLSPMLIGFVKDPASLNSILGDAAGATVQTILDAADGIIGETLFQKLTYKKTIADDPATDADESAVVDAKVDTVEDLIYYLDQNMPYVSINAAFNFDESAAFTGVNISAAYQAMTSDGVYNAPTHKFTANIHKAIVGSDSVDVGEGYVLTAEQRLAMKADINLVNLSVNGTIDCYRLDDSDKPYETLTWSLNMDINPFVLAEGITAETFKKLGYIDFTIVKPDKSTLLTIHCNSSDGYLLLSFIAYEGLIDNLAIGGKYEFGALMDVINIMGGGKVDVNAVADVDAVADIDITALLKAVIGALDFNDIKENGLVLDTSKDSIKGILDCIPIDGLDSMVKSLLPTIVQNLIFNNAESVHFKVNENGIAYGEAVKIDASEVKPAILRDGDYMGVTGAKLNSESDIRRNYEFGEEDLDITYRNTDGNNARTFLVKGRDPISGRSVTTNAIYMGSTFDSSIVGNQTVRVYYGTNTRLSGDLGALKGVIRPLLDGNPMLPLYGANYIEIEVNVYEPVDNSTSFVDVRGTNQLGVGENVADKLDATIYFEDGRSIPVTSSMISAATPILDGNGNILFAGKWELTISYYTAEAKVNIEVGELFGDIVSEINIGVDDALGMLNLRIKKINESGIITYEPCKVTVSKVVINGNEVALEDAFISESYKFQKRLDWIDKTCKLTVQYEMFGEMKERTIEFKLVGDGIVPKSSTSTYYPNQVISKFLYIKSPTDNKYYYAMYNTLSKAFELRKDFTSEVYSEACKIAVVKKGTTTAAVFDQYGVITIPGDYTVNFEWAGSGYKTSFDIVVSADDTALSTRYPDTEHIYSTKYQTTLTSAFTWNYGVDQLVSDADITFSNYWTKSTLKFGKYAATGDDNIWALTYSAKVGGKSVTKVVPNSSVTVNVYDLAAENKDVTAAMIDKTNGKFVLTIGQYKITLKITIGEKVFNSTMYLTYIPKS